MLSTETLFRPFSVKSLSVPNRIVMAPMTRSFSPGGVPGPDVAAYYRRRAEGGVGLILSEGTVVNRPAARNDPAIPLFHGAEALAGWAKVIDEVHSAGGKMGPQIWHVGSARNPLVDWVPPGPIDSPSGLLTPRKAVGSPMSDSAIADTIEAFGEAAAAARALGFDTVEIHAAHGYLIDQYFWSGTNRRQDRFGGPGIGNRARFGAEIVKAVSRAVGPDIPVIVRLSQWKQQDYAARLADSPAEMAEWLTPLVDAGADILHCSQRRFWEAEFPEIDGENGLNFAGWAKKLTGLPTISVGSVGLSGEFIAAFGGESSQPAGLDRLVRRMEKDEFDLIAVGRAILADPNWVRKIRSGSSDLLSFGPEMLASLS